jgi:SAM-dependent methyltransferase
VSTKPTERFSSRVADYAAARPGYPTAILDNLRDFGALPQGARVADIGSGTGISTSLFLEAGCRVFAVEPNAAMRAAAETRFAANPGFTSVAGTAESTTLPEQSVDLIAAGQAFHWFYPPAAHREFLRILRPGGWITLFWNTRDHQCSSFMGELEELVKRFGTDFSSVSHEQLGDAAIATVLRRDRRHCVSRTSQQLSRQGLHARLLRSSYLPSRGTPAAAQMLAAADELFDRYQEDEAVTLLHRVDQHVGRP